MIRLVFLAGKGREIQDPNLVASTAPAADIFVQTAKVHIPHILPW